uniref:Uncharacterized protein n=1 Tax=Arundo donax TaxID=35708 RepID=A0A0A9AY12_ARUDO
MPLGFSSKNTNSALSPTPTTSVDVSPSAGPEPCPTRFLQVSLTEMVSLSTHSPAPAPPCSSVLPNQTRS